MTEKRGEQIYYEVIPIVQQAHCPGCIIEGLEQVIACVLAQTDVAFRQRIYDELIDGIKFHMPHFLDEVAKADAADGDTIGETEGSA